MTLPPVVLHVDDSEDDQVIVRRVLDRLNLDCHLSQFARFDKALEALEGGMRPALVLVERRLKRGLGEDLIGWIRDRYPDAGIAIYLFSSEPNVQTAADGIVAKHVDIDAFESELADLFLRHLGSGGGTAHEG